MQAVTLTQLNRGESRHSVARAVFHGQRGELRQRYREGQEDQLGALGLVVNGQSHFPSGALNENQRELAHYGIVSVQHSQGNLSVQTSLIARYSSLPCDYADATLIALAERTGVASIATIDQRDFSVYRIRGRKRFRMLLRG